VGAGQEGPAPGPEETLTTVGRRRMRLSSVVGHWVLTLLLVVQVLIAAQPAITVPGMGWRGR